MDKEYWVHFVAGWVGGCAGLIVGQPLDTIKVRQQTLGKMSSRNCIMNIFRYEGIRGFYKGLGFPLIAAGTMNSIFFGVYGSSLRWMSADKDKPSLLNIFVAGCAGGVAQLVVACPVDIVKIKMQMQMGLSKDVWGKFKETNYKGPTACFQDLYKKGGVSGCYTGINTMFLRDVPTFGLYMLLYEVLISKVSGSEQNASPGEVILCGGLAGLVAWASIIPLDVIKSRIQADSPTDPQYKNTWDCVVKSYRGDGLRVFTRGFWMMSLRAFPTNGAIFFAYVNSLNILRSFITLGRQENEDTSVLS